MSTNNSSLAYDDIREHVEDQEITLDPEFNLIINKLSTEYVSSVSVPVKVRGRVTVSF